MSPPATSAPVVSRDAVRRLRAARLARGWSQRTLARKLGVAPSTVDRWEQGRHAPGGLAYQRALAMLCPEEGRCH